MKKIKFIVIIILAIAINVILGEVYVYSLDSIFDSKYKCTFASDQIVNLEKANKDFSEIAHKHNLGIFAIEFKNPSEYLKEYHIYSNEKAKQDIFGKSDFAMDYQSIVGGKSKFILHNWSEIKDNEILKEIYFSNDESAFENMRNFKRDLIDEYGGGFPKIQKNTFDIKKSTIISLAILFFAYCFMTIVEIINDKKEYFIRLIQGEDILKNNLKAFFIEQILLAIFLLFIFILTSKIYYLDFLIIVYIVAFIVQFFVSCVIVVFTTRFIESNSIKRTEASNFNFKVTYIWKLLIGILLTHLLYTNGLIIKNGVDYFRQQEFFEQHKNYHYYQMNYKMNNKLGKDVNGTIDSEKLHSEFYSRYFDKSMLMYHFPRKDTNYDLILLNKNSLEAQNIQLDTNSISSDVNLIIYSPFNFDEIQKEKLLNRLELYYPKELKIRFEKYNNSINIIAIDKENKANGSFFYNNPVLVVERKPISFQDENLGFRMIFAYNIPFELSDEEFQKYVKEHKIEDQIVKRTNIFDVYMKERMNIKRSTSIISFASFLFLSLNVFIISLIIKMHYFVNRKEMVLKNILGYSILEKNKGVIILHTIISMLTIIILIITSLITNLVNPMILLIVSILIILSEMLVLVTAIRKNEKILVSHVIKGGN